MSLRFEHLDGILIACPEGPEIGADRADEFRRELLGGLAGHQNLVLDLSEVTFMDSSGLGVIVAALKALRGRGELRLCHVQPRVLELFRLTGLGRVFPVEADRPAALRSVRTARDRNRAA